MYIGQLFLALNQRIVGPIDRRERRIIRVQLSLRIGDLGAEGGQGQTADQVQLLINRTQLGRACLSFRDNR